MSEYDELEDSSEYSRPLVLYLFNLNDKTWAYTSADSEVTRTIGSDPIVFSPVPINHDGISQTGDSPSDTLTLSASSMIEPAQIYMGFVPSSPIVLRIFETQEDDDEVRVIYMGEIKGHEITEPGTSTFTVELFGASMAREGLRLSWNRSCPYALYDQMTCKVNKEAFKVTGTIESITGNVVSVASMAGTAEDVYSGGFIEWTDSVRGVERRAIEKQNNSALTMFGTAEGLTVGLEVSVYRGCARTTDACISFSNIMNYGGVPALIGKSPFDAKSSVF